MGQGKWTGAKEGTNKLMKEENEKVNKLKDGE
jgi:hypothetical protein